MTKFITIDPGAKGAVVLFADDRVLEIHDLPVLSLTISSKRKVPDVDWLHKYFHFHQPDVIVIEQVSTGPADGGASGGAFMVNFGAIIGAAANFPRDFVLPARWKAYSGLVGKVKVMSVKRAILRYPETAAMLDRQKNVVDRADAVLIGDYYRNMVLKKKKGGV